MKNFTIVTLLLVAGIAWSFQVSSGFSLQEQNETTSTGEKSRQVVAELSGVLESSHTEEFRNWLPGETTLLYIAPHGKRVQKGDLLFELDDSRLREKVHKLEIEVQAADGIVDQAKWQRDLIQSKHVSAIETAKENVEVASLRQQGIVGESGKLAVQTRTLERELVTLEAKSKFLTELKQQAHPQFDLQARFLLHDIEPQIENIKDELMQHRDHTVPLETAIAEQEVQVAKRELNLREIELRTAINTADSQVYLRKSELDLLKDQFDHNVKLLESCKVIAKRDGIVLHPQPAGRRVTVAPLEEGAKVREMQTLVTMPDLELLIVRARIHESQIKSFAEGDQLIIRVDALPDGTYPGFVREVKPTIAARNAQARQFELVALVDNSDERLRPGMTCQVKLDKVE